jgi:hypothetical protein
MKTIYQKINELQQWVRENQARGSDKVFMEKVKEMQRLMNEAYEFRN